MNYVELCIHTDSEYYDILIAELAEVGFDTFDDNEGVLKAYISEEQYNKQAADEIILKYRDLVAISTTEQLIPKINWNEEWEKSFKPVEIGNKLLIRASFHEPGQGFEHEIIINPKMSFGTGHHDTTYQMAAHQFNIIHNAKKVLDMGAGTGILAILAEKLGAQKVVAIDIDQWSVENGIENAEINNCAKIEYIKGDVKALAEYGKFDIILANINLNVLKQDIPEYVRHLASDGYLLISGFYENDVEELEKIAQICELQIKDISSKNNWASVVLRFK